MILRERRQTAGREEIMRNKTIEAISFPGDAAEWQARVDLAACFRLIVVQLGRPARHPRLGAGGLYPHPYVGEGLGCAAAPARKGRVGP